MHADVGEERKLLIRLQWGYFVLQFTLDNTFSLIKKTLHVNSSFITMCDEKNK